MPWETVSELVCVALSSCLAFSLWNGLTDAAYSFSTIIATRVLTPLRAAAPGLPILSEPAELHVRRWFVGYAHHLVDVHRKK